MANFEWYFFFTTNDQISFPEDEIKMKMARLSGPVGHWGS
jgi:hypothetical protein